MEKTSELDVEVSRLISRRVSVSLDFLESKSNGCYWGE